MNAKPPETFGLDRLQTPIGIALLVTDADGALRALDWEDYELRLRQLLRLQYGATVLQDAPAPHDIRAALTGYFKGDLDRLNLVKWRVAGTAFQRKVWTALRTIPVGTTLDEATKRLVAATVEQCKGNKLQAARILGIPPRTMYRHFPDLKP